MPWRIERQNGRQCVVNSDTGQVEKCHDTKAAATKHLRALYANVPEAKEQADMAIVGDSTAGLQLSGWPYTTTAAGVTINVNPGQPPAPPPTASPVPAPTGPKVGGPPAVLTEVAGRVLLTAPCEVITSADQIPREMAALYEDQHARNPYWLWIQGRFVEAERSNANGAYWTTQDLEFGEATVTHAPLNLLHDPKRIIGSLTQAHLYYPEQAQDRAHIAAQGVLWRPFFPTETRMVELAAEQRQVWFSMECVGESVSCESSKDGSREGCGETYPFEQAYAAPETICDHLRERSSQRHINKPVFMAGAVIIPPAKPAWAEADVEVANKIQNLVSHRLLEAAETPYARGEWEQLMGRVLEFGANT